MFQGNARKSQFFIATAVAAVSTLIAAQHAGAQTTGTATIQVSSFAPTGADLAQPNFGAPDTGTTYGLNDPTYVGYQDFVDNGSNTPPGGPGEVFSVNSGFTLKTLTVKGGGGSSAASAFAGGQWTLSLGTAAYLGTGAAITVLDTETVDVSHVDDAGNKAYVTFALANPLALTPGTNYVYMIHRTGGGAYYGFAKSENTVDHLPNAASFAGDLSGTSVLQTDFVHNGDTTGGFQDRTFFLNGVAGAPVVTFSTVSTNWVHNGSGNWEAGANWASNPQVPGAIGSNVTFDTNGGAITALSPIVTLSQAATLTTMTFDRPGGGYTINNGANGSINLTAEIDVLSGNNVINVPVVATTPAVFTAATGSSLSIPHFSDTGYGSVTAYGGGTITLGGIGNCTLHSESPDAGATAGAHIVFSDNTPTGFLYAIITDTSSSVNVGVNTVQTSGIYGSGQFVIPAGGVVYDAIYGDNPFGGFALVGGGSLIIGNNGTSASPHVATLNGLNTAFSGTMTVGTNAAGQFTLVVGAATTLGDGSATNGLVLDGGILQASASFNALQPVTVTALANLQAGSTTTDSKIDTNGFNVGLGAVTSAGTLTKISAGTLTVARIRGGTLAINAGGVAIANSASRAAGVSVLNTLTLAGSTGAWTTTLDLNNNDLIIHNGDLAQIRDQIKQGYNLAGQNGTGGILSAAAGASTSPKTILGYGTLVGTVDGQTTVGTDVVIRYTVAGDANLDLNVNFNDLVSLAQNYGLSGRSWAQGDFNYDGSTTFNDLVLLAQNYGKSLSASEVSALGSGFASDYALALSLVPEPTTLALVAGLSTLAVRRRRALA